MKRAPRRLALWKRVQPLSASPEEARARLADLVETGREEYAALSRMIGRAPHYLGRHVRDGSPARLKDGEREQLALYFRIDARELGAGA